MNVTSVTKSEARGTGRAPCFSTGEHAQPVPRASGREAMSSYFSIGAPIRLPHSVQEPS